MICRLRIGGTTLQKTITGDTLAFSIPDSVPEQAKCRITLLEPRTKKTKFETEIPVTRKPETPLAGECGISPDGITLVDGKPFMPLGFFCNLSDRAVSLARSVGANIFLSYAWMGGLEGMRKWMDVLQKNEMKLLFSIKHLYSEKDVWNGIRGSDAIVKTAVEALRKHPALLGWYICDELPPAMQEKIIARHRMVNKLDPYHPTYAVYYQASELFGYSPGLDVLGVDVYPIRNLPPEKTDMARAEAIMEAARKTGKTIWAVPQIFDYRIYVDEGRPPTEQEMRSLSLLMAGLGAKGFIYYMLNDLWRSNKLPKDNFEREWPKVRSVVAGMKKLEPFILSKHPIAELPVQCGKGKVRAFRLTAEDGRKAVLVCSILAGAAEASWKLPGSWRSLHGKTTFADGLAKFKGSSIDSDVLMEQ